MENKERIVPVAIEDEMRRSFIDYSMSVIIGRALPDVRDGLKPVHRRILYTMRELGLFHNRPFKKSARLVGDVLGKFHPHGDSSVYDAMVRMNQPFAMRYPLVDGQGNFGSVDGDPAAAMRYTETRMTALAAEILADIDKETVEWKPNYDEAEVEPTVLPSRIPNLLLNGSSGIAVGMATNIPPHHLGELAAGIRALIDNPELTIDELMTHIPGPDFPTGGIICGRAGITRAFKTGRGSFTLRCRAEVEPLEESRERIRVDEIPYQVNKSNLLKDIAHLVNQKAITGISDLRDESDKDGMRIIIELKRGENGQVILNQLYKHTALQINFSCNMLAIHQGRPVVMGLKDLLHCWIEHRREVLTRATRFDLDKAEKRAHILEGFKTAIANIDAVIEVIKKATDRNQARTTLMERFQLSEFQANAILELRLYQITAMEAQKIEDEYRELQEKISGYKSILADPRKVDALIKGDMEEVSRKYADQRRTSIEGDASDLDDEDLIADEPCIITVSHLGYIKRVPVNTYRSQRRGGRGVAGMETRDEDYVEHLFTAKTHDTMMIFTASGMLHWLKVYTIPQGSRTAKGKSVANLLEISPEDKIAGMITVREFDESRFVIMATNGGVIKKTRLSLFSNVRRKGIIAMNVKDEDRLIAAHLVNAGEDILMITKIGQAIRFAESRVSPMGRTATGVKGITLDQSDEVVGVQILHSPSGSLLVVCENGYGKRTPFEEFRVTGRAGKGIIAIKTTERNGPVIAALPVSDGDDLMLISACGMMLRVSIDDISSMGRNTQGVRIANLKDEDALVATTPIERLTEDNE